MERRWRKSLPSRRVSGRGRRRLSRRPYALAAAGGNGAGSRDVGVAGKHLWPSEAQLPSRDMVGGDGLGAGNKHITRGVVEDRDAVEPGPRHFLIAYLTCRAPPSALGRWPNHTTYNARDGGSDLDLSVSRYGRWASVAAAGVVDSRTRLDVPCSSVPKTCPPSDERRPCLTASFYGWCTESTMTTVVPRAALNIKSARLVEKAVAGLQGRHILLDKTTRRGKYAINRRRVPAIGVLRDERSP